MRIKSFVLLVCIILNIFAIPSFAQNDATESSDFNLAVEFIKSIGIADYSDPETSDPKRIVNRAEFTSLIVKMTNQPLTTYESTDFSDVDFYDDYGSAIYTALSLGIISKSPDGLFNPESPITYEAAAKMAVCAIGYDKYAKAKGGYPSGYIAIADGFDILDGTDSEFTLEDALILVSNTLRADIWDIDSVRDNEIVYKSQKGKTLLSENFKLSKTEGVATTAGLYSMNRNYDYKGNKLELNGVLYDCKADGVEKYLGYYVEAWYNDKSEIVAVIPGVDNNSVTISSEEVEKYSDFVLETYENDRQYKYNISKSYSFIKNGRYYNQTDSDFKFSNGTLTLIDNNGDRKYDFVIAKEYTYLDVCAINELDKVIYDTKQPDKTITLDEDTTCVISMYDYKSKTYSKADFDSIEVGSLLEILKSHDGRYVEIVVLSKNKIEGTVAEIGYDYVAVDGTNYKIDSHFYKVGNTINIGEKARFSLSSDGRIVIKVSAKDEMKYGYYLGYTENEKKGLNAKPMIKILTATNQVEAHELTDRVTLDSVKVGSDSDILKGKLIISGAPKYQLIKYRVNIDGEIDVIDTANPAIGENIKVGLEGNDCLTQYVSKGSAIYKDSGIIAPYGKFAGGAIFSVPKDLTLGQTYPDDYFACKGVSELSNDDQITVDMFDYSEHYVPKAAVMYVMEGAAGTVSTPADNATPYMVEAVTGALDREGNNTVKLTLCSETEYLYYTVSGSVYEEMLNTTDKRTYSLIPSKGDIVRIVLDSYGEVIGIARDVIMNADGTFKINFGDAGVRSNIRDIFTYATGTLTSAGSGALTIDKEQYGDSMTFELVNNKMTYSLAKKKAVLYSGEREYVRPINIGDVNTEMVHGAGNEDKVVVCACYLGVKALFVYRNN